MAKDFEVYEMPEELTMPLLAAVRLLERTLNPAFSFVLRCLSCGKYEVGPVASVKDEGSIIGLQCASCKRTIKFTRPLRFDADDFPDRLRKQPASALTEPGKGKAKVTMDPKWLNDAFDLVTPEDG